MVIIVIKVTMITMFVCEVIIINKEKTGKTFPLRLKKDFSEEIDNVVFLTKAESKHQYIMNAIKEKMERDLEGLRDGKRIYK